MQAAITPCPRCRGRMDASTIRHTDEGTMCQECAFKLALARTRAGATYANPNPTSGSEDSKLLGFVLGFVFSCLALGPVFLFSSNSQLKQGTLYGFLASTAIGLVYQFMLM